MHASFKIISWKPDEIVPGKNRLETLEIMKASNSRVVGLIKNWPTSHPDVNLKIRNPDNFVFSVLFVDGDEQSFKKLAEAFPQL